MTLHETAMNLYHNIQGNLKLAGEKQFEIVSPHQVENYHQKWKNYDGSIPNRENLSAEVTDKSMVKELKEPKERTSMVKELKEPKERLEQLAIGNDKRKEKPKKLKSPRVSSTIQIFHSHHGRTIQDIEEELKKLLMDMMKDISFKGLSKQTEIDNSKILIVLCIITSRVGTDAANAIRNIKNPAKTALVLIHVKEGHALRNTNSTSILTDEKFKDLGGIFDLAYVYEKGIYSCAMNDDAVGGICKYIRRSMFTEP